VPPRTLAAPLHRHSRDDEYSVVLEGTLTVQLGEQIYEAQPGDVVAADPTAMPGERAAALDAAYGLEVDYASIDRLCAARGLTFPA
jgi:hypothetical protein